MIYKSENMNRKTILIIMMVALLLPLCASTQNKPKIKTVDITLELPKPGSSLEDAREQKFSSAVTEYGDLNPSEGIQVMSIDWDGDFKEDDDGGMFFKDGFEYQAMIQFLIDPNGKYDTDYIIKNGEYILDGSRIKVTVNGKPAHVQNSTPYVIYMDIQFLIGSGGKGSDIELAKNIVTDYILNKDSYRATLEPYSIEYANANSPLTNPRKLLIIDNQHDEQITAGDGNNQKAMLITKMIIDTDNEHKYKRYAAALNFSSGPHNIREVWISDKVDATAFFVAMFSATDGSLDDDANTYTPYYSSPFYSQRATLFVPESAAEGILKRMSTPTWKRKPLFAIKTYSGDVYQAQKAGADAAKPFCTNHIYTAKIAGADRRVRYVTCNEHDRYYYSCKICGKCEHNEGHTFVEPGGELFHVHDLPLADDQAYVGVNAAGHHVWWYSCTWCGKSPRQVPESKDPDREKSALRSSTALPGFFILPKKSTAKISRAYQSSVNYALCDNLIDEELLGNDYTKSLNQLQLRSLAVRLAEELVGKEIKVEKKVDGKYNDAYTAKAASMGILNDYLASLPNTQPATREDVATVIYNTLRYIEKCRIYSYTEYDSRLGRYSDSAYIAPWAKEAVAFMDALGLIKGESESTFASKDVLTIEWAIDAAEKSVYAHQLGWYQSRNWGEADVYEYLGFPTYLTPYCCLPDDAITFSTIAPGERVWVVGPRLGGMSEYLPVKEPVTGQTLYVKANCFRPVRKYVFKSEKTTLREGEFKNYMDGQYIWYRWN